MAVIDAAQAVEVRGIEPHQGDDAPRDSGAVRDNDERLIRPARSRRLKDGVAEALPHDLGALNLGTPTLTSVSILGVGLGLLTGDFLVGLPLEGAVEALREPLIADRTLTGIAGDVEHAREDTGRVERAHQRRAHDAYSPVVHEGRGLATNPSPDNPVRE